MIGKPFRFIIKSVRLFNVRFAHQNYLFKMDKAYVRQANDQFQITFKYDNPDLKVNRQFNFCRQNSEKIASFLTRVSTNIEKVLHKKNKKKKDQSAGSELLTVKTAVLVDRTEVDSEVLCGEVFQPDKNITLRIFDKDYSVIVNSPWVDAVALPKSMLANFPVYPSKFETVFTDKNSSVFSWYRSVNNSWVEVGKTYIYTPSNEDVNSYLKFSCIPRNGKHEGPLIEIVSEVVVDASPGLCPFELRHNFTANRLKGNEFRVVSYNILADLYCDSDYTRTELFPYCPPYALSIEYRKQLIVKELLGYNADIICLQEVDRKVFNHDLEPIFSFLEYEGNFCIKGGEVAEGLACFYDKKRFQILESHRLILSEHVNTNPLFTDIWQKISANEKLVERFLERPNAVQVCILESLEHKEILVVANTHLYFHPDADHIRLLQGGLAIRYLESVVNSVKEKHNDKRVSLIFCGDFNSVPECGIYKLYTTGNVPPDFVDYKSNKEETVENVHLTQPFKLGSACGTPKYTNFTAGFADCLDYIFYEQSNLKVSQVVPLPSVEELTQNTALPSVVFPSDHISLVADLKWL